MVTTTTTTTDPITDGSLERLTINVEIEQEEQVEEQEEDEDEDEDEDEEEEENEKDPPPAHRPIRYLPLSARAQFDALPRQQKLYAHHLARAAWTGAPIIFRQVSAESLDIFHFILHTHHVCGGDWDKYLRHRAVSPTELDQWLEYAARFLSNMGNYHSHGDHKFVPEIHPSALERLAGNSALYQRIREALFDLTHHTYMGFPSDPLSQSQYYPSDMAISEDEIAAVTRALGQRKIQPENTRIEKTPTGYVAHIASVNPRPFLPPPPPLRPFTLAGTTTTDKTVEILYGDHADDLARVTEHILKAVDYTDNPTQRAYLSDLAASFRTGDMETYRDSVRHWVRDKSPRVESIFGFVEPYRDPHGVRAEFEGVVALTDSSETEFLQRLVDQADGLIRKLPWTAPGINNDKGHFENAVFEPPDFTSIRTIAYCSSSYFIGINLPNYNDIRERCGFKNVIVANVMGDLDAPVLPSELLHPRERAMYSKLSNRLLLQHTMLHELLGHGTSRLLTQDADGNCNFDAEKPPVNPLTGMPVTKWYGPRQTWYGQCNIATTVDECRAELVSAVLADEPEVLALFGWAAADDELTDEDVIYGLYQLLAVEGLSALTDYNTATKSWSQAHSRASFGVLNALLRAGVVRVHCDRDASTIHALVDRATILTDGKPTLRDMLLRLHIYRCTGDGDACRAYYDDMTTPEHHMLPWSGVLADQHVPERMYVQPNTFLTGDGNVRMKEYELSAKGMIESWYERL